MASDVQQTYFEWQHGELSEQEDSQGPSISQMLDHGSISFGKFAFESLSWEKRSVFTHNERQAELEKFKSPGLVAKKKAYFEEYYKKIRALKAMQNQQTEISLEYGADGSISSQTGDEDEPPLPSTSPNEMPESISEAPLEDHTVEVTFEQACSEAFEHEYVGPGFAEDVTAKETIEPHKSYCDVKKEENYSNSVQVQISDSGSLVHRLSTGSSKEFKPIENNHDVKWTYKNDTNLKMEPDLTPLACSTDPIVSNAVEADFVPVDNPVLEKNKLTVHKPKEDPTSVPMSKEHAASARCLSKSVNKSLSERIKSSLGSKHSLQKTIDKADIDITSSKKTSSNARSSDKSSFVASHPSPTVVQNKVAIPRPGPLSKERKGAIPTNARELVQRSQSKVSNRSASSKFNPKGKLRVQGDSRETATQNTIKNRALQSKSVGHEELKKKLDNKYSTVEGGAVTEQLQTRSINLPSRNNHDPIGVISYQSGSSSGGDKSKKGDSRETATQNTIKNRALQSKSVGHEELKKNLDNKCSTVEGRAVTEQIKTRSINLPSRNNHDPNVVISYQSGSSSGEDKSKKTNASTLKKYEEKGSKITTFRQSGNIKVDTIKKQVTTVEKHEMPYEVSKSFIGRLSFDVKKSRLENPRWR